MLFRTSRCGIIFNDLHYFLSGCLIQHIVFIFILNTSYCFKPCEFIFILNYVAENIVSFFHYTINRQYGVSSIFFVCEWLFGFEKSFFFSTVPDNFNDYTLSVAPRACSFICCSVAIEVNTRIYIAAFESDADKWSLFHRLLFPALTDSIIKTKNKLMTLTVSFCCI